MKHFTFLPALALFAMSATAVAAPTGAPDLVFNSSGYADIGEENLFSFLIGTTSPTAFTIVDGLGERQVEFDIVSVESGSYQGNWVQLKTPASGQIKIWGDTSKIDVIVADGGYITSIDNISDCHALEILSLEHNNLQKLDLSSLSNLQAVYLTDNPFTEATPLKIGGNKPDLQILEIDIIDWLDQSFNLSDYPALVAFDGYHNMTLYNVDPTGCPNLQVLSLEMAPVSSLDVTQNPRLTRLNISETRITDIDLSNNPLLQHLLASHDSGTINNQYFLNSIDLSHNPDLRILSLAGNNLSSIDLSANTKLTNLTLNRNKLTSLNLDANKSLYSIWVLNNNLDFATLPWPQPSWGEYFYRQNPMEVPRSIEVNSTLDLSSRVLREGTQTQAIVWKQVYSSDDVLLDPNTYSYADGKITFNTALPDSVYVEFFNDVFNEYTLTTKPFRVKTSQEYGQPTKIAYFVPASYDNVTFGVGLYGASEENPRTFYVDFGDGVRREFSAKSAQGTLTTATGNPQGQISIWLPEGEVLTSLDLADVPLSSINVEKATELIYLNLSSCGLNSIDLKYNRCLQYLNLDSNNLYTLDLAGIYGDYEKNVLRYINVAHNNLSNFECVATRALNTLEIQGNQLEELVLDNYDNLGYLDASSNKLSTISLEYLTGATYVNLSHNSLKEIKLSASDLTKNVDLSYNNFLYPTLPTTNLLGEGYVYAPQNELTIAPEAPSINLVENAFAADGTPTSYSWKKTDGSLLTAGTDYTVRDGITTFLNENLGNVYCEMTNSAFPEMTGEKAIRTTATHVIGRPTNVVASFKPINYNGNEPCVIFAASEPMQLYIDWMENGDLTPYAVETTYINYPVYSILPNANVKIYACNPDDAAKITVLSIYDIKLAEADFSPLTGISSLNIGNTDLAPANIQMPVAPGLRELNLTGNRFENYPYAEDYPNVYMLNLAYNKLQSFDASPLQNLGYLVLSNNKLTEMSFNNPMLWSVFADNNSLEEVDLNGLPSIEQITLHSNKLEAIDLNPVSNTLKSLSLVDNRFLFSTLPLPYNYPQLQVMNYGNQAPVGVEFSEDCVDLSSEALIDGNVTEYTWWLGMPEYDEESMTYQGTQLEEGTDYEIENGVTHFLKDQRKAVYGMMTNATFPNLILFTEGVNVKNVGVQTISDDSTRIVNVYSIDGTLLRTAPAAQAADGLTPGLYIIDGVKTIIR